MKAVKETVKQYYRTFTQPTLASNGTMGGDSFACTGSANVSNAYIPFSGTGNLWDTSSSPAPQYITWYNPNAINITYMTIGQYSSEPYYYYITSAVVQGSNDNSTWTDITTIGNQRNVVTINVDMSSNTGYYKYHRLYVSGANYSRGYPRVFVGAIKMTATEYIEAGFDVDVYKLSAETVRKYYKYQWNSWTSPTNMTSNTSYGTISGGHGYTYLNGSGGSGQYATNGATYTMYWTFPQPVKISTVYWYARSNPDRWGTNCSMYFYSVTTGNVETSIGSASYGYSGGGSNGSASLDGTIEVSKLKITSYGNWSGADGSWFLPIGFSGTSRSTVSGTSEDYDYYIDIQNFKGIKE